MSAFVEMSDGGLLDIIVIERHTECRGIGNFPITLFKALVFGVEAKSVFPRFSLNGVRPHAPKFLISWQNSRDFGGVSALEQRRQCDAIFDSLVVTRRRS